MDNPKQKDFIKEFGAGLIESAESLGCFSRTLELAVVFSPLLLLSTKKLSSVHIARSSLCMASISNSLKAFIND